jgi:hypothetical protein
LWFVYLAIGQLFRPTSALTHIGGIIVGYIGLKSLGMPRGIWWKAIAGLWLLLILSRWLGTPELNVNLAFHLYESRRMFPGFHARPWSR